MRRIARTCFVGLTLVACAPAQLKAPAPSSCTRSSLDIDGNHIWVDREGTGDATVVFESGFGNDSSVWSQITPRVRAAGVQTFVYDRAGMGKSSLNTNMPYSIDNDAHILRSALTACGVNGPIVMVGHSYGGAISLLAASDDARIKGIVLLDAVVPKVWPPGEVDKNLKRMRADYDEIREKAPELARVAIPWAEAMPETAKRVDALRVSDALPIIDIIAENGQNSPESTKIWRDAHAEFTANHPRRELILAAGSSHKVMADKPDLVVDAILKVLEKRAARSPSANNGAGADSGGR